MTRLIWILLFVSLSLGITSGNHHDDDDDARDKSTPVRVIPNTETNLPLNTTVRRNMVEIARRMGATQQTMANMMVDPSIQASAATGVDPFIIGGQDSARGAFPYIASIRFGGLGHFCGGVLISSTVVLTAAHCVVDNSNRFRDLSQIIVVLGENNLNVFEGTEQVFSITRATVNQFFTRFENGNDIAVLQLNGAATFNRFVQPIALPRRGEGFLGRTCNISGWGVQIIGESDPSTILQFAPTNVISNTQCSQNFPVNAGDVCTNSESFDTGGCSGDSGGPLDCGGVLVGLVSRGSSDCSPALPTVFTRVSAFLNFIEQFL